jgi:hypothetical protein
VHRATMNVLDRITIADLAEKEREGNAARYSI